MPRNWIRLYNKLFTLLNTEGSTYHSGPQFLDTVREVDDGAPTYRQLIDLRTSQNKSTSRKDYYYDVIESYGEAEKVSIYNAFIRKLEPLAPIAVAEMRELLQDGVQGPIAAIPPNLWNAERLTAYLEDMDAAIVAGDYNRTLTLAYTCLEGFYKAFIRARIPDQIALDELMPMSTTIRDYIRQHLQNTGMSFQCRWLL